MLGWCCGVCGVGEPLGTLVMWRWHRLRGAGDRQSRLGSCIQALHRAHKTPSISIKEASSSLGKGKNL